MISIGKIFQESRKESFSFLFLSIINNDEKI